MAGIRITGLDKRYDNGFHAVRGIDLAIADREFMVLVGPSGCGKTTTLRMIAGLEEVTGGTIAIGDRQVERVEPKDRDIAFVFQNYALYPHMTVFENMAYALRLRRLPDAEVRAKVAEAARMLGLETQLARRPGQLSGGQRQRVALGRAVVRHPQVFLFDEPLSNLDAKLRGEMRFELRTLQRRLATTMVYVTHDQAEAMTLGDRITVMNHGSIQQVGTPEAIYDRPWNRFVAGFLGTPTMNFLAGEADGQALVLGDGRRLRLPPGAVGSIGRLTLGFRPETLAPGDGPEGTVLELICELVESLGDHRLAYLAAPGGGRPLVMRCDAHAAVAAGNRLAVRFAIERGHAFAGDADNARNLCLPPTAVQVEAG